MLGPGCANPDNEANSQKRMGFSTGGFNQGYKDGKRDAKWSLTDIHAAWTWLWITEKEYQQGYEQGWKDGREFVRLKEKQKRRDAQQ